MIKFSTLLQLSNVPKKFDMVEKLILILYNVCSVSWEVPSTVGVIQYHGGYHEYLHSADHSLPPWYS